MKRGSDGAAFTATSAAAFPISARAAAAAAAACLLLLQDAVAVGKGGCSSSRDRRTKDVDSGTEWKDGEECAKEEKRKTDAT